ncbi:hypothetical protein Unana1_05708 [Umbelopsis nana]
MEKPHEYDNSTKPNLSDDSPQDTGIKPNLLDSKPPLIPKNSSDTRKGVLARKSGLFDFTKRKLIIAVVGAFLLLFIVIFVPAFVKTRGSKQQQNADVSASDTSATVSSQSSTTGPTRTSAAPATNSASPNTAEYCLFGKQGALYTTNAYCQVDLNPNYYIVYNCSPSHKQPPLRHHHQPKHHVCNPDVHYLQLHWSSPKLQDDECQLR